jgi:prophage tail gpP-like protein
MEINAQSTSKGRGYGIVNAESYDIDCSIDTPADRFNITFGNPHGKYNGLFDVNDSVQVSEQGVQLLDGIIDETGGGTESGRGTKITIDGRDRSLLLLDNDAVPQTYKDLTLSAFIQKLASPYGFGKFQIANTESIKKIVVEPGMSEWDAIFEQAFTKMGFYPYVGGYGTFYCDLLKNYGAHTGNTTFQSKYQKTISNEIPGAIKYESIKYRKNYAGVISDIWIKDHKDEGYLLKKKNPYLANIKFSRRKIIQEGNVENMAELDKKADNMLRASRYGNLEITAVIKGSYNIAPNELIKIVDSANGFNNVYFVIGVRHTKNIRNGAQTIIRFWTPEEVF